MFSNDARYYLNTLIFTIVVKAVSVVLLVLLFTAFGAKIAYLLLTIEIGLVAIAIYSLYNITNYSKKMKKQVEALKTAPTPMSGCPDYHTKMVDSEQRFNCTNTYVTPNRDTTYVFNSQPFILNDIFKDGPKDRTLDDVCVTVKSTVNQTRFGNVPWTDLRSKCELIT